MADWYAGNYPLNNRQSIHNARIASQQMLNHWWSKHAVAAIIGNMQGESGINPGAFESYIQDNMDGGYGLVQWTPATKYSTWATANGYAWRDNGDAQIKRIFWEAENGAQWLMNYPVSFADFVKSDASIEYLTAVWLYNYERPADPAGVLQERIDYAQYYYDNIVSRQINVYLLLLFRRHRRGGVVLEE